MQIVWFKRDLRIHDHEPLARAAARGPLIPLYIVEPGLWQQDDNDGRHWPFWFEALSELREGLADHGQPLVVRHGDAIAVLRHLIEQHRVTTVWSHEETGNAWTFERDRAIGAMLRERNVDWQQCRQHGVVRGRLDRDRWSRQWEALMRARQFEAPAIQPVADLEVGLIPLSPRPDGSTPTDPCPGRQRGGRSQGRQALVSFLKVRGEHYHREMSSPRTADSACSRLSAHLATGSLSMREVVQQTRRAQASADGSWKRALAAFEGRLHWHCHFIQKFETEPEIEVRELHAAVAGLRRIGAHPERLQAWCNGQTGWPFVDACMRYLAHHGWINFRMRAMLMAVASYQLWLHWRESGLHLARLFVDYEPGIHWAQAQMQSGTTGINTLRIYNPIKQSMEQDPDGAFIRRWVPELATVGNDWVHAPWTMPADAQRAAGVTIGESYPEPLVDHVAAARLARQRLQEARRGEASRAQRQRIHRVHGSRRRAGRQSARSAQPSLFPDES